MENQLNLTRQKLRHIIDEAPIGIIEIDQTGAIIQYNIEGEKLLKPAMLAHETDGDNFYSILDIIAPALAEKIRSYKENTGSIAENDEHHFSLEYGGETIERYFSFNVSRMSPESTIIFFNDTTRTQLKKKAIMQLGFDKAMSQEKLEIASNVLHDIGNAVVGFGTHLNRIRRVVEKENHENLQKLSVFFLSQQKDFAGLLGDAKAGAIVSMLNSLTENHKANHEELGKAVKEQLNIITHIQEILNIQRQYLSGNESQLKDSVQLRGTVNACMSMLSASFEKRGIKVEMNMPTGLPEIMGNRTRLMQVILNILKNSMEAIDIQSNNKHISINASADEKWLTFAVKDSGHGFDNSTGDQIFKRGFTTKASGTGLGLSNCRAIIENHSGEIAITSEGFGKGATVTIKFKL